LNFAILKVEVKLILKPNSMVRHKFKENIAHS